SSYTLLRRRFDVDQCRLPDRRLPDLLFQRGPPVLVERAQRHRAATVRRRVERADDPDVSQPLEAGRLRIHPGHDAVGEVDQLRRKLVPPGEGAGPGTAANGELVTK